MCIAAAISICILINHARYIAFVIMDGSTDMSCQYAYRLLFKSCESTPYVFSKSLLAPLTLTIVQSIDVALNI